ncbi:poly(A) RNA polymerase, mitochondrial-like [Copidosoma floridanum]|uniref:poly(A) RNA polymerase, mitochondrial-like n=1 Tax=Copidosoma floridanum TaxID=29053 RepID=UPI0006C9C9F1|nr:poly(A) RNA polymerase, mitochondrial-like [Copidosoma floridanum]
MSFLTRAMTGSVLYMTNNCYCKLTQNCAQVKFHRKNFSKTFIENEWWCSARFMCSGAPEPTNKTGSYVVYDKLIAQRRAEAQRSIVIQVLSYNSCADVYTYCSQFGSINKIFHYSINSGGEKQNLVLIEFEEKQHVDAIMSSSTHVNYEQAIPTNTSLLWFRNLVHSKTKVKNVPPEQIKLTKNSIKTADSGEITKKLLCSESISDQILTLYNTIKLNDAGTRLRFHTAYQIEHCFSNLFPNIAVLPFGSSVNGFGKQGCDLDLCLVLDENSMEKPTSRLVFQTKSISLYDRQQVKRLMEVLAQTINLFLPGVSNVKKILEARVPIIKFDHSLCGIQCDLAVSNMTAYYMSELLYIFGETDPRVRPLTFVIRKWADSLHLINKTSPGPWISNFSLTLMVIFFLQQRNILPSINALKSKACKDDIRVADTYVDCTFLRNIEQIPKSTNTDSLEELLVDFFTYYTKFDFNTNAISLRIGKPIKKSERTPLYICNPLETNLNVSKNVSSEQLDRIMMSMQNALYHLEFHSNERNDQWGLIGLFLMNQTNFIENTRKKKLLNFKELFEKDNDVLTTS